MRADYTDRFASYKERRPFGGCSRRLPEVECY